jgi:hypothetical protein
MYLIFIIEYYHLFLREKELLISKGNKKELKFLFTDLMEKK